MESSNLRKLLLESLAPIRENPNLLLMRVLGEANYYKMFGLLNSPFLKNILPVQFTPEEFLSTLVEKLAALPPEFYVDLETTLRGVLDGDAEAYEKAKKFLGVVVNGH